MAGKDWRRAQISDRMSKGFAERASREDQRLAIENFNARLRSGGPVHPSPSIGLLRDNGYRWIQVLCRGCGTSAWIDLNTIRASPWTEIAMLDKKMKCRLCVRRNPPPVIECVLRRKPPMF